MKLWLFAIFILSVSAGTWWKLSAHNNQDDVVLDISSTSADAAAETQHTEAQATVRFSGEAQDPVSAQTIDAANQQDDAPDIEISDTVQTSAADGDSDKPFDVVGAMPQQTAQSAQDQPAGTASVSKSNGAVTQQASQGESRAVGRIAVPDSYPVTEAAKYYIPKERA